MPATVIDQPLGISCVFSDGRTAQFCLDGLPCPDLVRDLSVGLVELIHPHGTIDSAGSVDCCLPVIRQLVGNLADRGFTGGAAAQQRSASPTGPDPAGSTPFQRLQRENAHLRGASRDLSEHLDLAIAHIQRLTLETHGLRQELEAATNITRIATRHRPGPSISGPQ